MSVPVGQRVLLVYSECEQGRCMQRRVDEPRLPRSQGARRPGLAVAGATKCKLQFRRIVVQER